MTGNKSEFSLLRERAGLTIEEAASTFRVSIRSAYRYESGQSAPTKLVMEILDMMAEANQKTGTDTKFRFIDLFAGIGGLRVGFENIGGKCVFTSEWDKFATETYRKNFREDSEHVFAGDIREFTVSHEALAKIPEHDVLLAGFPCQPFSIAGVSKKNALGRPHGFTDITQGTLFFDLARIIEHHRPRVFLLENVKNLRSHDGGNTFRTIMNVLVDELGYRVETRVISARPWVPRRVNEYFWPGSETKTPVFHSMMLFCRQSRLQR